MTIHICTADSFYTDAPSLLLKCVICGHESVHDIGYVSIRCSVCKSHYDPTDMTMPDVVRMQRERLGLSRKEMAELTGYSKRTIKQYELVRCSKVYYEKTLVLTNKDIK